MPARLKSSQDISKQSNDFKYITVAHTSTHSLGDFVCRWAVLLAAALATIVVLTGGVTLVAIGAAAVLGRASATLMCGHFMASKRKWNASSQLFLIMGYNTVGAKLMMNCSIGGMIRVAPGCTSFWKTCAIGLKNTAMTVLENIAVGAVLYYGGRMIATRSFSDFSPNLGKRII